MLEEDTQQKIFLKSAKYLELMENDVRTIDKAIPVYILILAIISIGYSLVGFWLFGSTNIISPVSSSMILIIQPYLVLYTLPIIYFLRKYRKLFFGGLSYVYRRYGAEGEFPLEDIHALRKYAAKIQRYWDIAIGFILIYLVGSGILMLLFFWSSVL